jgi:hypothetical protein
MTTQQLRIGAKEPLDRRFHLAVITSRGNGSGNLTGIITCDNSPAVNMSTATTTQIIAISGKGGRTYICSIDLVAGGADNVALISGSGSNCA